MSNISYYKSLPSKGEAHMSDATLSITDFIYHVKHGKWKDLVDPIRAEEDKKKRDVLKKALPAVTVSGVFAERKENLLIQHSGFIQIDVDNFTDKSRIETDAYTYAVFDSCSGRGFTVIVKVDPLKHKQCFLWLQKYYYESFGITVDRAPQNVASIRYVSYDPKVEINEKSKVSKALAKEPAKPKSLPIILSGAKVDEYVLEAVNKGFDLAASYADYLNLSFALTDGFREAGRRYFHSLCSVSPKYNEAHADKQYDIALKRGKAGITVGTFYHMLKTAGVNIKNEHQNEMSLAVMGKKTGRTKEAIVTQLVEVNHIAESTAKELVESVFSREDLNLQAITFDPEKLIQTLCQFIEQNHPLKRNLITKIIEEKGKEVTKERLNTIFLRLRSVFNHTSVTFDLIERIIFSEFTPDFHPITEYIENNRHRTSTGNIDKLIATIETNSQMANVFIRKWCLGIIAAYNGFAVRSLLALLGGQYTGKTEWFRRLLPKDLKKYYGESKLDAGKDDELLMCSKLVLINDEMGGKSKHDEKLLKELTSKDVFSLRAPYGRHNEDFKRLAILGGTSNELDIMQDPTGNTRIYPIEVLKIDHDAYNAIDKDELFMELVREYESGAEWMLNRDEINYLKGISKNYEGVNYEKELILEYFAPNDGRAGFVEEMTALQIKMFIENSSRQQIKSMKLFGMQLKQVFGRQRQKKNVGYVYTVIRKGETTGLPPEDGTSTPINTTPVLPVVNNNSNNDNKDIFKGIIDNDDLPF